MTMPVIRGTMRNVSVALIVAGFLCVATLASAQTKKAPPPPAKPAPAAAPAARPAPPAARPAAGNPAGAGMQRPNTGPSANQPYRTGPTASGGGARITANGTGGTRTPTAAGPGGGVPRTAIRNSTVNAPRNTRELTSQSGSAIRLRSNGRPSDVHDANRGMDVHHGLNGGQRVSVEHADHSRTVFERGRPGYVQHPYSFRGHDFARRSYFYHGRSYDHFYHGYAYRGGYLHVYGPSFYYGAGFYGWAYNPWASPIAFGWGFGGSPWYGYYGYYFSPYASYPSASYWLTDYMISSDLQASYAAHQEAGEVDGAPPAASGPPELTPEVKQQIADEVRNQLALENQEAAANAQQADVDPGSSGIDRLLSDAARGKQHVFVVGSALDVVDASQTECTLSDGDVLALQTAPPTDAKAAALVVLSSKGGQECQKQAVVSIALEDLQEMQNHMRETIDQGLQELQAKQGKGVLPAAPSSALAPPAPAQYASIAPPPDPNAASEIQQQAQQADQAEKEVTAEATQPNTNQ